MKILTFLLTTISIFYYSASNAQTISGEWYGIGNVERAGDHNSYLSELKIKQKGKKVTGQFNYFFRRVEIKSKISGIYDAANRTFILNAQPILNFQAKNENGADCPMTGIFVLKASRLETTLTGRFKASKVYRFTCPPISIRFVKSTGAPDPDIAVPVYNEEATDTLAPPAEVKKQADPNERFVKELNQRAFEESPVIDVDSDSLKVILYDNGEVDQDTVSVFYNRELIAGRKMLSDKPLTITVPLDTSVNEIAMYAENLGKIPPNTALAVIYAGEKRFELGMTSTFIKNATLRFRRKKKDPKNIN